MRILAGIAAGGALLSGAVVPHARAPERAGGPSASMVTAVRLAARDRRVRLMLVAAFASGVAYGAILVYQVPILVGGGLALTTAATMGGLRGAFQFVGRVGIVGTSERFGARRSLVFSYGIAAVGVSALLWGGSLIGAGIYAVLVGVALGAVSPLQAIYGEELYPAADLGALLGVQSAMVGLAGAFGPLMAGIMVDLTGGHVPTIWLGVGALVIASTALSRTSNDAPNRS